MKLHNATLGALPDHVKRPQYDRTALRPGIVHIGLGNFHRAHQAWYVHRLMQMDEAHDWAIIGAGVRPYDAAMREKLLAQDCLTTLIELDPAKTAFEVSGSMIDYLPIADGNGPLIEKMADPAIRIVSLTVTEGGYYLDAAGGFDESHADIRHDAENPTRPRTAFGAMVAALKQRRDAGAPPFTAMSCDNLQGNGKILRQSLVGLAKLFDPELAGWISENVTFPNSMVDCIVPATDAATIALAAEAGIEDAAPVSHEPFRQWVIEDKFCAGRPAWEKVGATLTDDVHAYETMKIRILNGGHQLLANAGDILSVATIADCMADADISAFFRKVEREEVLPHVQPVPEISPNAYLALIERRFTNPRIKDTTRRVAFDGSSRHPGFLHPSLNAALAADGPIEGLALAEALWARMCAGEREDGSQIEPNDPDWPVLQTAALHARSDPAQWLAQVRIYDALAENHTFTEAFHHWLESLWTHGCRATLNSYV